MFINNYARKISAKLNKCVQAIYGATCCLQNQSSFVNITQPTSLWFFVLIKLSQNRKSFFLDFQVQKRNNIDHQWSGRKNQCINSTCAYKAQEEYVDSVWVPLNLIKQNTTHICYRILMIYFGWSMFGKTQITWRIADSDKTKLYNMSAGKKTSPKPLFFLCGPFTCLAFWWSSDITAQEFLYCKIIKKNKSDKTPFLKKGGKEDEGQRDREPALALDSTAPWWA